MARQLLVGPLVRRVRRHLLSFSRGQYNQFTGSVTATATSIPLAADVTGITVGSYVSLEDETVYVQQVSSGNNTLTVIRGMDGTTPVAHNGTVTPILVEVNPRYPVGAIRDAIVGEIRSWTPTLFRVRTGVLLTNIGTRGYDIGPGSGPNNILDPEWIEVLDVRRSTNQSGLAYGYNALVKTWPRVPFRVDRLGRPGLVGGSQLEASPAAPSGPNQQQGASSQFQGGYPFDFPSGVMLTIKSNYYNTQMAVTWATAIDVPDILPDSLDLATLGVEPTWGRLVEYGAAGSLMLGKESVRNTIEVGGESRHSVEVPPQAIGAQADRLLKMREREMAQACTWLSARYGVRFKG